jgi:nicotinate-nucleotide pyrophosphorylase (carboxylating)
MQNAEKLNSHLRADADRLIALALEDDIGSGDVTCESLIPEEAHLSGSVVFRKRGILSGLWIAERVFKLLHEGIEITTLERDGDDVDQGEVVLTVSGPARAILTAERTALNFLQRLSGVATITHEFVQRVAHTQCHILDTRKTTPGWRRLEKYAVTCGGGTNHRMGLYDRVLVKDNHLALRRALLGEEDWTSMVKSARKVFPDIPVEIEVDTVVQYKSALKASPDWILLDNMSLDDLTECVQCHKGETQLEASGGVTLEAVTAMAETGVDAISVGALTHSVPALDISLDYGLPT